MYFDRMWRDRNQTTHYFILKPTAEAKCIFWHFGTFLGMGFLCWVLGHVGLLWLSLPVGLNGKAKSLATETGGIRHCWDFLWIQNTSFPVIKRSGGVGSCCLTVVRRPFTRIHFSTWHCGATLNTSYNFAWSWCSPGWGELETICEAAQGCG